MKAALWFAVYLLAVGVVVSASYQWLEGRRLAAHRANQLFVREQWVAAIPHYQRALADVPVSTATAVLQSRLAVCWVQTGASKQALTLCQQLLAANALDSSLLGAVVDAFWQRNDRQAALQLLAEVLAVDSEARAVRLQYARLLSWDNRFAEAVQHYRMILGEPSWALPHDIVSQP